MAGAEENGPWTANACERVEALLKESFPDSIVSVQENPDHLRCEVMNTLLGRDVLEHSARRIVPIGLMLLLLVLVLIILFFRKRFIKTKN